nr:sensor histidine kinase [Microvirga tunisiensis]
MIGLRPIRLDVEAESHSIPLNQAVSVGLIINELLVNALKYAFPGDRSGHVRVTVTRTDQEYCLAVSDNGVGLPATQGSTPSATSTGLGQRLIRSFVMQLNGRHEIEPLSHGTGRSEPGLPCQGVLFAKFCLSPAMVSPGFTAPEDVKAWLTAD